MGDLVITFTRLVLLALVAVSAVVSLYAATNAVAVSTNHTVFVGGLAMVAAGVVVQPLFCFIATFGLVRYSNVPLAEALALTLPVCVAWLVAAARGVLGAATR